ncbi:MAG: aldo/keto reductase [Chloroflexi bacterium]|nr:aldo/keto reductase [Chloroflexota bacterium]
MKYGTIRGLGDRVSRLILGSMVFHTNNQELTNDLLDTFHGAGGNAVDLANVYGRGASEAAFGAWLKTRGTRKDMIVMAKGAHPVEPELISRMTPEHIVGDLNIALERTGAGYADMYVLHKDDEKVPVNVIVDGLDACVRSGKAKVVGGSSWSTARLGAANAYAAVTGKVPLSVSSPNHSLAVMNEYMYGWAGCLSLAGDVAALAWYTQTQMPVLAWSSQARGFFSGRMTRGAGPESGLSVHDLMVLRTYDDPKNWARLARTHRMAEKKGCTNTQIALAWVLHQPFPVFALIGPRTVPELNDCFGALEIELTPEEVAWLNLEEPVEIREPVGAR